MKALAISSKKTGGTPLWLIKSGEISAIGTTLSPEVAKWAKSCGFSGAKGQLCLLPDNKGKMKLALFGLGDSPSPMEAGKLPRLLPDGDYQLMGSIEDIHLASLSWVLGAYQFGRYVSAKPRKAMLVLDRKVDRTNLEREGEAAFLARDLINTPANDMGPDDLEKAARSLARTHKAKVSVIKGDQLLRKNFPMIHAVGRASTSAPRLIDMKWGAARAPKVTLVGKGVIFDTGGLNIKPGNSMALMKKDMGGAANVLALAQMIMSAKLKVRLRVLIPAVENAISGNAFRPGDVLPSRKGISVEIGNTDAEGRLVLADALTLGDEEKPDLMIDMATLTGAARVALGPDLPPYYTDDDVLAADLAEASQRIFDPLWRMPLWPAYQSMLTSKIADVNHITAGGFAGSITAALFLSRFVEKAESWVHFDIFGWVPSEKPWAKVGGEAQGIRALFDVIAKRYS